MGHNIADSRLHSPLVILTRPPSLIFKGCVRYFFKHVAKKIFRIEKGPEAVVNSLIRGLNENGVSFEINKQTSISPQTTVHVLSNVEALRWAIKMKASGLIKHIVAGPNLVVFPDEYDEILADKNIDVVLVPSEWVKKVYEQVSPALRNIFIWPSGVKIPNQTQLQYESNDIHVLIYKKKCDERIFNTCLDTLKKHGAIIDILSYGHFSQKEYFDKLDRNSLMLYLQESESQGLALQEAWARSVPTLVWNKGRYTVKDRNIDLECQVSAPYLTKETGLFFENECDFEDRYIEMVERLDSYIPRKYCEAFLSDKASANIYLQIMQTLS